jgi:hypothetical protein
MCRQCSDRRGATAACRLPRGAPRPSRPLAIGGGAGCRLAMPFCLFANRDPVSATYVQAVRVDYSCRPVPSGDASHCHCHCSATRSIDLRAIAHVRDEAQVGKDLAYGSLVVCSSHK